MRLGTVRRNGTTQAFRQDGGVTTYLPAGDIGELLSRPDWRSLAGEQGAAPEAGSLAAPILRPGKILCAGLNYYAHAEEVGQEVPKYPTIFTKFANALVGPTDDVVMPAASSKIDWEAELTVVIGSTVRHADEAAAREAILGYTVLNDVSVRDWQGRTPEWFQGKNWDRMTPWGPVIVTADELDPESGLAVECEVDGVQKQSGTTADLIFSCPALVAYISEFMTLEPGDIIATGTPAGVGLARKPREWIPAGAELVTRIEGIGELRNRCVAE
ncbi:fumarylacetoacetate hydrolase family protein [Arthrobacter sp. I2-34]|uniref:Fumarylacetoacetate hydrolase family protein n=1 Tax=Arthrobacter hankyongi TaxID=2904801 RepID=A0ABS9L564_9MICC|nr:fumarylacetoacetate hydrolase family protein [Arthrobacter hankyongi]MCG2621804.1 fumarylacetoacetate hydrolase family protein [Arthrobacter hankyongi]